MTTGPIKPPKSVWASVIPGFDHVGEERPDLWQTLLDVLGDLDGEAKKRLEVALRDPWASDALVGALEQWEATDGALAAARARHGIAPGAVASRLRKAREALADETALADMVGQIVLDGIELEQSLGIPEKKELTSAARAYAGAARRLRNALARAEAAAPKAKGRQPDPAKGARLRLAADLCQALGGEDDAAYWSIFVAVWAALMGDDPNNPDPPNMQEARKYINELRIKGEL